MSHIQDTYDTLTIISYDEDNRIAMFESEEKYINFDKKYLKKIYKTIKKGYCDTVCGVDALIEHDDTLFFIEFQNQKQQISIPKLTR